MNRFEFRKRFKTVGPAVLAVIHALDRGQVVRNAQIAAREGAHGVFLINHDLALEGLLPLIREVRDRFPSLWLGVNFLGVTGARAFPVLGDLEGSGCVVDAYWADDARIDEHADVQREAGAIDEARRSSGWSGLYLGGAAFKKQRTVQPEDFEAAARVAARHMDAVTTSGAATGRSAKVSKIEAFRAGCADQALAVASGVTPDNAASYAGLVDAVLVATGINRTGNFYDIEPMRLRRLLAVCREAGAGEPEPDPAAGWYLPFMAPNVKGDRFACWIRRSIYINARAFHALVDDLIAPFDPSGIDVVAGFDAMGFVLGSANRDSSRQGISDHTQGGEGAGRNRRGRLRELLQAHPADGDAHAGVRTGNAGAARRSVGRDRGHDGRRHPAHRTPERSCRGDRGRVHRGERRRRRLPQSVPVLDRGDPGNGGAGFSATARRWTISRASIPPVVFRRLRSWRN